MTAAAPSLPAEWLVDSATVGVRWFPTVRVMEFSWRAFVSGTDLHEAFDHLLRLSLEYGAEHWLTDYSALSAMRLADQDWLVEEYTPRVIGQIDLVRSAIVRPAHPLGGWFLDSMIARLSPIRPWPIQGFASRAEAFAWLVTKAS